MTEAMPIAPRWADQVQKHKVAQLYKDDANGMHDEVLISDVAFTLFARCQSMLIVEAARNGQAACPVCETLVDHEAKKGAVLACQACDWTGSWDAYPNRWMDAI